VRERANLLFHGILRLRCSFLAASLRLTHKLNGAFQSRLADMTLLVLLGLGKGELVVHVARGSFKTFGRKPGDTNECPQLRLWENRESGAEGAAMR
jgi:hypothetical protein